MASKYCPRPKKVNCKKIVESFTKKSNFFSIFSDQSVQKQFKGSIISIHSAEKALFYIIKSNKLEKFCRMEAFTFTEKYRNSQDIKFGDIFIYHDENTNSKSRAYRLISNTANFIGIRAFLIDTGVEIYQNFQEGKFFKIPQTKIFESAAMGIFCQLNQFPASESAVTRSEFLKQNLCVPIDFSVRSLEKRDNALGLGQYCLVVDVEAVNDDAVKTITKTRTKMNTRQKKVDMKLTFMDENFNQRILSCFVLQRSELPPIKSTVLLNITHILSPNLVYANYKTSEDFTKNICPEFQSLELLINNDAIVERHENLEKEPVIDEMVLAIGKNHRYHRGTVKTISRDSYLVSAN